MTNLKRVNGNGQTQMSNEQPTLFDLDLRAHLRFQRWSRLSNHALNVARYDEESHPAWQAEREASTKLEAAVCAYQQAEGHEWWLKIGPGEGDIARRLECWYRAHRPDGLEPLRYEQTLRCDAHDVAAVVKEVA